MSHRQLKRVALDFSWPRKKTWKGYINPHENKVLECPKCGGSGYSETGALFKEQWYGDQTFDPIAYGATPLTVDHPQIREFAKRQCTQNAQFYGSGEFAELQEAQRLFGLMEHQWCHHLIQDDVDALIKAGRLMDFTHRPINEAQVEELKIQKENGGSGYWLSKPNGYHPTADEVNAWSIQGIGHDSINAGVCIEARCKREGVPYICALCEGHGTYWAKPQDKIDYDSWEPTEPPTGEGYQLWYDEFPLSRVFETLQELCQWAEKNETTFANKRATAEQWEKMLSEGFVAHIEGNKIFCG